MVTTATPDDLEGLLSLAAEVEDWFGPMVADAGFREALERSIVRGTAFVVRAGSGSGLLGGLVRYADCLASADSLPWSRDVLRNMLNVAIETAEIGAPVG